MSEEQTKSAAGYRMRLTPEATAKIDGWQAQADEHLKAIKLSRHDLANWMLSSLPEELSKEQLEQINRTFFSPVLAMEWATEKVRAAVDRGEAVELEAFLKENVTRHVSNRSKKIGRRHAKDYIKRVQ